MKEVCILYSMSYNLNNLMTALPVILLRKAKKALCVLFYQVGVTERLSTLKMIL